ncbi:MAG TPA: DUF5335 family protein [Thermoanaerobaculia bacterium]|jgi:hypothetical protein|nr:DUF5335 family protein [Thermoanaerobaculia bacterium]
MATEEIGPSRWRSFFDRFSVAHEGSLASVEVLGRMGAQPVATELPLVGIVADEPSHGGSLSILIGRGDDAITHSIARPARVEVERTAEGADAAVEIESEEGDKTLLTLSTAIPPGRSTAP